MAGRWQATADLHPHPPTHTHTRCTSSSRWPTAALNSATSPSGSLSPSSAVAERLPVLRKCSRVISLQVVEATVCWGPDSGRCQQQAVHQALPGQAFGGYCTQQELVYAIAMTYQRGDSGVSRRCSMPTRSG